MAVRKLRVEDFRCLGEVDVDPATGLNFFYGENASGKTSLLEALFVLGRGRSFRASRKDVLIRDGKDAARVIVRGEGHAGTFQAGLEISGGRAELRVNGEPASNVADVAERLPVEVIDPDVQDLVSGGPAERRRYLDWSVFHVEPSFLGAWRRYQRALRHRTALLRQGARGRELDPWEEEMELRARAIDEARQRALAGIVPLVRDFGSSLLDAEIRLAYRAGHGEDSSLGTQLAAGRERDAKMGQTVKGPHRADVHVEVFDRRARGRVSRGQQKLVAASMILGQHRYQAEATGETGVLLVDDVSAELDRGRVGRLLEALSSIPGQVWITALDRSDIGNLQPDRMFHVEQGTVTAVV